MWCLLIFGCGQIIFHLCLKLFSDIFLSSNFVYLQRGNTYWFYYLSLILSQPLSASFTWVNLNTQAESDLIENLLVTIPQPVPMGTKASPIIGYFFWLTYFFFPIFSKDYSCWGLVDQSNTRYQLTTKETLLKYYKLEYEVDWTIYTNSTSYTIWCWIKTFHEIFGNFKTLPTELWLALHRGLMINPCFIN